MAGTIEFIQQQLKLSKKEWQTRFLGMEDVLIVHNSALEELCPMYMQNSIDKDKTAFYVLAKFNPLKGDCSRQTACEWLEDFMYDKCECPSSYDIDNGMYKPTPEHPQFGTMSRKTAVSKELLPADNDAEYMNYYDEQMAKLKKDMDDYAKAQKKQQFIDKHGFDTDDPDIIDIPDESSALPGPSSSSLANSTGTAVGMPKPIWYGFVFHANGFGMKLGYDKKAWSLQNGNVSVAQLAENCMTESDFDDMVKDAQYARVRRGTNPGFHNGKTYETYDVQYLYTTTGQDTEQIEDIYDADSLPNLIWQIRGDLIDEYGKSANIIEFISVYKNGREMDIDKANSRLMSECDMPDQLKEAKQAETDQEISEILEDDLQSEDECDSMFECGEETTDECDMTDEDDDMLSESVIRHATMLAKEIW